MYYYGDEEDQYYYDEEDEDRGVEMEEYRYSTVEEANAAFVGRIRKQMEQIYGGDGPYYVDQLCFHMYPTTAMVWIRVPESQERMQIQQRFWTMPIQHPLAVLLQDHYHDTGEHVWKAKYTCPYGDIIIYDQDAMDACMRSVAEMCEENEFCLIERYEPESSMQLHQRTPSPIHALPARPKETTIDMDGVGHMTNGVEQQSVTIVSVEPPDVDADDFKMNPTVIGGRNQQQQQVTVGDGNGSKPIDDSKKGK